MKKPMTWLIIGIHHSTYDQKYDDLETISFLKNASYTSKLLNLEYLAYLWDYSSKI